MSVESHVNALSEITGPNAINAGDSLPQWMSPRIGIVSPGSVFEIQEIVRYCASEGLSLGVRGAATAAHRSARPEKLDVLLSTLRLNSATDFQPDDLVLAAEPGFTGAQTIELLTPKNLILTLDPPRFEEATLGGMASARSSGPARFSLGTPRDLLIGATVVNSSGEITKTGGKVVKNVSGYDLCKLYAGSYGTLGILVETVWRLSPRPDTSLALIARLPDWNAIDLAVASIFDSDLLPRSIDAMNGRAAKAIVEEAEAHALFLVVVFDGNQEQAKTQIALTESIVRRYGCQPTDTRLENAEWNSRFHNSLSTCCYPVGEYTLLEIAGLSSQTPEIAGIIEGLPASQEELPAISAHAGNGIVRACYSHLSEEKLKSMRFQLKDLASKNPGLRICLFDWRGGTSEDTWISVTPGIEIMQRIRTNLDPEAVFSRGRYTGGL